MPFFDALYDGPRAIGFGFFKVTLHDSKNPFRGTVEMLLLTKVCVHQFLFMLKINKCK